MYFLMIEREERQGSDFSLRREEHEYASQGGISGLFSFLFNKSTERERGGGGRVRGE